MKWVCHSRDLACWQSLRFETSDCSAKWRLSPPQEIIPSQRVAEKAGATHEGILKGPASPSSTGYRTMRWGYSFVPGDFPR